LRILLDDRDDGTRPTVGAVTLAELYRLTYRRFDDSRFRIDRDVLVMLWLRLIEAATHTFSLRVYADSKLNYQVIYELCVSFDNEERRLDFCLKNHCERNSVITKTRLLEIFPGKKKI